MPTETPTISKAKNISMLKGKLLTYVLKPVVLEIAFPVGIIVAGAPLSPYIGSIK